MNPASSGEARAARLMNQIRWATRLSYSLNSTQNIEDIYAVLVAGLLSPTGMGLSFVVLLDVDIPGNVMLGRYALGYESAEAIDSVAKELTEEDEALRRQMEQLAGSGQLADALEQEAQLQSLQTGAEWVTLMQRLGTDVEPNLSFSKAQFVLRSYVGRRDDLDFLSESVFWRHPRVFKKEACRNRLPGGILSLLHDRFAAVPIVSGDKLRSLLFVDRRFSGDGTFSDEDIEEISSFATQVGLAIDNVKLISDLNRTYTELKQVETLKSNFLSTISHELRTPLTSMIGFIDLVHAERVGPLTPQQKTLLERVLKNTKHMITMVNDLIEVAELQVEGMVSHSLVPVDPLDVLMKTLPGLENRRRDKRGNIEPILPPSGRIPRIVADPEALRRIFFHLIDNALKFSQEESKVSVLFRETGDRLEIVVRDKGIGIAKEKLAHIFDRFYQVDNSLTRSYEGLGIGLSVTRMLIRGLDGTIRIDSVPNQGTEVTVSFPVAPEAVETEVVGRT